MLKGILFRLYQKYRILLYRALSSLKVEGDLVRVQPVQTMGSGRIIFKGRVTLGYFPSPHYFSTYAYLEARNRESIIEIGRNTKINNGFVAIAENSKIIIGENCLIGTNVEIYDSDFHALSAIDRKNGRPHFSKIVRIGNNVFIGSNVKVLKGVTIGDGAVIANGSIVTRDIPKNYIAAGMPAKPIQHTDKNCPHP